MRGRGERSRVEELEDQLLSVRLMARHLWAALRARTGMEAEALLGAGEFGEQLMRAADLGYDAAATVWERHRISVRPCRQVLEHAARVPLGYPRQIESYVGVWPDGSTRNLTRAQLLMMAGFDPEEAAA